MRQCALLQAGTLGGMLAGMKANAKEKEKEALRALRRTCTKAVQRPWFADITGLMPELEAVLQAAGGPLENLTIDPDALHQSQNGLRKSCMSNLDKLGPDHAVSRHLRAILNLIGDGRV